MIVLLIGSLLSLVACDQRRIECTAPDCSCSTDDECVLDDCAFYLPESYDACRCEGCDVCLRERPVPERVRDEIIEAREAICVQDGYLDAPQACGGAVPPCDDEGYTWKAQCSRGKCVAVGTKDD